MAITITDSLPLPDSSERARAARREQTSDLFRALDATADVLDRDRLRERITALNMCIAKSIAHRYRDRGENTQDLEQVAYVGLVKAVNGFDNGYHKDFLSYAVPTIAGELKKHFRDYCWTVRPPRRIQELQRKVATVSEDLSQSQAHRPTTPEVAEALDIALDEVTEALGADGCFNPASLDVRVGQTDSTAVGELIGDEDHGFDEAEARMILASVVGGLSDRDRDIIELRFFHDWSQERIAQDLGLTQMQVSRLISKMLTTLRERLGGAAI